MNQKKRTTTMIKEGKDWMLYGIFCRIIFTVTAVAGPNSYQRAPLFDNMRCSVNDTLQVRSVSGVVSCLATCSSENTCTSVFYRAVLKSCFLCKRRYWMHWNFFWDVTFLLWTPEYIHYQNV